MVGNAVFSEAAVRTYLIFRMKLGDYKGGKVTEPDFWKKFLNWRYSQKSIQISPKSDTLIFFSKTAVTIFLIFGLKLVLNMTFNLNETFFQKKLQFRDIWPRNRQKIAQIEVFGNFLDFASLVFLDFARNDRWAWCYKLFSYNSPIQSKYSCFFDWKCSTKKTVLKNIHQKTPVLESLLIRLQAVDENIQCFCYMFMTLYF